MSIFTLGNIFAFPTTNSWDENVFQLTTAGVVTVVILIVVLLGLAIALRSKNTVAEGVDGVEKTTATKGSSKAKQLAFSGVAMALGLVTSEFLPTIKMPMGGSVTLFSMLFIVLIGYWYGLKAGLMSAFAYGLLQFVIDPIFYSVPQMIVDYLLAFGALGLSGLFSGKKQGLILGYITGVLGRYIFAVLSGVIFFAMYAPEGTPAIIYSLGYNAAYLFPEAVITLILIALPPVAKALKRVKLMAQ
jgi:thiamine transporter